MSKIQRITQPPIESIGQAPNVQVGLTSLQGFELAQRAAQCLARSTLVPKEYQGNLSNCVVALNMAQRIGADPLMVMQNLVIVHGRPTWSAQFLIATFNSCGRFSAIRYEFFGEPNTDGWGCRATARELATGEILTGTDVTIGIAKAEGWHGKNGSKWKTMPQQMLQYRAAAWFVRTIAPEISMGLHTTEEIHDVYDAVQTETGAYTVEPEADQNPIKSANPPESSAEAAQEAETEATDQESDGDVYQLVNTETGEITNDIDPLEDLKLALSQCTRREEVRNIIRGLTPEQKKNQQIRNLCTARGEELGE